MTWVTLRRIPTPVQNKVGSILHFTERARNLSTQLGDNFGRTVSQRRVAVEQASELIRQRHAFFLRFASRIAHSVNQRHIGGVQQIGGSLNGFVDRSLFAIDQGIRILFLSRMVQEPGRTQHAGFFGFVNADVVRVKFNVVANASAKSTRCIVDHSELADDFMRALGVVLDHLGLILTSKVFSSRPNRTTEP